MHWTLGVASRLEKIKEKFTQVSSHSILKVYYLSKNLNDLNFRPKNLQFYLTIRVIRYDRSTFTALLKSRVFCTLNSFDDYFAWILPRESVYWQLFISAYFALG